MPKRRNSCAVCTKPARNTFCSKLCFGIYKKRRLGGKVLCCIQCSETFWVPRHRLKTAKFCSKRCEVAHRKPYIERRKCPTCTLWFKAPQKYCTKKCFLHRGIGTSAPRVVVACANCFKTRTEAAWSYRAKLAAGRKFFCTNSCSLVYQLKHKHGSPNTLEKAVLCLAAPHGFKFVGDGKLLVGTRNPDFVHKKKRLIIEAMAGHWHPPSDEAHRIKHYKKYGYKCLVMWRQDLLKKPDVIKARVVRFAKAA